MKRITIHTDQLGTRHQFDAYPKRIISLVPSITELLYDLGLEEEVVGITRFCIHPKEWFLSKQRIGGTKDAKLDRIHELHPDLIIANKEENTKEQIEELAQHYPVWVSDVKNLEESIEMIDGLADLLGRTEAAKKINSAIQRSFEWKPAHQGKALYLIWKNPYMSVNRDTFIHDMMQRSGFQNCTATLEDRYPSLELTDIRSLSPDFIFLSSEPYPFKEKDLSELTELLPQSKVVLVDGEMFSWYGSRILQSADYFKKLLRDLSA